MDFYDVLVFTKDSNNYNSFYAKIDGKRCTNKTRVTKARDGFGLIMEIDFGNEDWREVRTSALVGVGEEDNGVVLLETKDVLYVLVPEENEDILYISMPEGYTHIV